MLFFFSKLFWLLLRPLNAVFFLMLLGALLQFRARQRAWRKRLSTVLLATAAGTIFLLGFTNLPDYLLYRLEKGIERPILPANPAGIIVLGGGISIRASNIHGMTEMNQSAERIIAGLMLAKHFPQARLVYSGGSWAFFGTVPVSEARWGARLADQFLGKGHSMLLETHSRNTWENAIYTRKLVNPHSEETWILITSAWHARRARAVFEKVGFRVIVWPVDYWSEYDGWFFLDPRAAGQFLKAEVALKEYVGILAYWLMGRM